MHPMHVCTCASLMCTACVLHVYAQVINADEAAVDSWAGLGVCMAALGQPDAAVACQAQVLRLRGGGGGGSEPVRSEPARRRSPS